ECLRARRVRVDYYGAAAVVASPADTDLELRRTWLSDVCGPGWVPGVTGAGVVVRKDECSLASVPVEQERAFQVRRLRHVGRCAPPDRIELLAQALYCRDEALPAVPPLTARRAARAHGSCAVPVLLPMLHRDSVDVAGDLVDPPDVLTAVPGLPSRRLDGAVEHRRVDGDEPALRPQSRANRVHERDHRGPVGGVGGIFRRDCGGGEEVADDVVEPKSIHAGVSAQVCVDIGDESLLVRGAPDVEENRGRAPVVNVITARVLKDPVVRDSGAVRDATSCTSGV